MNGDNNESRKKKGGTLPGPRSNLTKNLFYILSVICALASMVFCQTPEHSYLNALGATLTFPLSLVLLLEFFSRTIHAIEEYKCFSSRYNNNLNEFLKDIYSFPKITIFIILILPILTYNSGKIVFFRDWYETGPVSVLFSLLTVHFLKRNHPLECGTLYDSLSIENSNGLDYGSGMAHSFFHGYLKLVIPKSGINQQDLMELMRDYEDMHGVNLELYKLFLLIPKSLYCPPTLMNSDISPSIEESSSLKEKEITVAGVQNRIYKNSVYKIKCKNSKKYVCAEYATPLKTFKDVVYVNGEHAVYYQKHKNDIILKFYSTLKELLKHENYSNFCELIYYDDIDENGVYKDVGQVLLQRIRKLKVKVPRQ